MCSDSRSKAHPVLADIKGRVELTHEDLPQDPGARCKPCCAARRRLWRMERAGQLNHLRMYKY